MFQDFENFPSCFYGESCLDSRLWDWLKLPEHQRRLCAAYFDNVTPDITIDEALQSSRGIWESKESYARDLLEECGSPDCTVEKGLQSISIARPNSTTSPLRHHLRSPAKLARHLGEQGGLCPRIARRLWVTYRAERRAALVL